MYFRVTLQCIADLPMANYVLSALSRVGPEPKLKGAWGPSFLSLNGKRTTLLLDEEGPGECIVICGS